MNALHHHGKAALMPCRSRTTGRYMPASRQLADRLDKVDRGVERAFDALRPLGDLLERAANGPIGEADAEALRTAHAVLWSALDTIGDDVHEVRQLVGVADA